MSTAFSTSHFISSLTFWPGVMPSGNSVVYCMGWMWMVSMPVFLFTGRYATAVTSLTVQRAMSWALFLSWIFRAHLSISLWMFSAPSFASSLNPEKMDRPSFASGMKACGVSRLSWEYLRNWFLLSILYSPNRMVLPVWSLGFKS